jgi:hypothetical protein
MNLSYIGIGLSLVTTIFNGVIFILIKMNDLRHLELSVKELKGFILKLDDRIDKFGERIARIEGKIGIQE